MVYSHNEIYIFMESVPPHRQPVASHERNKNFPALHAALSLVIESQVLAGIKDRSAMRIVLVTDRADRIECEISTAGLKHRTEPAQLRK
jgi:hypothetical protein